MAKKPSSPHWTTFATFCSVKKRGLWQIGWRNWLRPGHPRGDLAQLSLILEGVGFAQLPGENGMAVSLPYQIVPQVGTVVTSHTLHLTMGTSIHIRHTILHRSVRSVLTQFLLKVKMWLQRICTKGVHIEKREGCKEGLDEQKFSPHRVRSRCSCLDSRQRIC